MGAVDAALEFNVIVIEVKIPTIDIVHISVAVVIDLVARNFPAIVPDVAAQIGMLDINPGIDDGNNEMAQVLIKGQNLTAVEIGIVTTLVPAVE